MANDNDARLLVGVKIPQPVIEKIDERRKYTGMSRQDVITQILKDELMQGC